MSTGMSTRRAKRQRCFEQEDDNQSNITFEGMDDIDDFGHMIPSPSGEVNAMEADFHSRGSISAVHELEAAAYGSHGQPPPLVERPSPPNSFTQASNMTVQLGTAISLPVDDVLARMSPGTPTEDALLDLYLMLSKAGSPLGPTASPMTLSTASPTAVPMVLSTLFQGLLLQHLLLMTRI
jgi:hypothetical protein